MLSFYPHKSSTSIYPIKPSNRTQTKVIWSHWWRLKFGQRHTNTTDALDGQHHSTAASGARNVRWSQGFPTFDDVDDVSPLYFFWMDSIFKMFMFYNTDFGMCSFIVTYILVFYFPWWMLDVHYDLRSCWLGWIHAWLHVPQTLGIDMSDICEHIGEEWLVERCLLLQGGIKTLEHIGPGEMSLWMGSWWLRLNLSNPELTNSKSPTTKRSPTTIRG